MFKGYPMDGLVSHSWPNIYDSGSPSLHTEKKKKEGIINSMILIDIDKVFRDTLLLLFLLGRWESVLSMGALWLVIIIILLY